MVEQNLRHPVNYWLTLSLGQLEDEECGHGGAEGCSTCHFTIYLPVRH